MGNFYTMFNIQSFLYLLTYTTAQPQRCKCGLIKYLDTFVNYCKLVHDFIHIIPYCNFIENKTRDFLSQDSLYQEQAHSEEIRKTGSSGNNLLKKYLVCYTVTLIGTIKSRRSSYKTACQK